MTWGGAEGGSISCTSMQTVLRCVHNDAEVVLFYSRKGQSDSVQGTEGFGYVPPEVSSKKHGTLPHELDQG